MTRLSMLNPTSSQSEGALWRDRSATASYSSPSSASSSDASRLLAGQTRILEMIALGEPLGTILLAITDLIDAQGNQMISSICVIEPEGKRLGRAISAHLPADFA